MSFKKFNNVVGILQARMSSNRLPGKVMKPIMGRPMLALQLERLLRCKRLDKLVTATSDRPEDDIIEALCIELGIAVFRGNLENVLDRFYQCAMEHGANHVVRLTGDCPLSDPVFIDVLVDFYMRQSVDYASNCRPPTLPDGLDAEVFSFTALQTAWREATESFTKEHVTPFIVHQPERFLKANWTYTEDLSHLRWTVDEPDDFRFVTHVYEALYPVNRYFGLKDVLTFLSRHPELVAINNRFMRNEGSKRST